MSRGPQLPQEDPQIEAFPQDPAAEAGRILRYWAGALAQMDLFESAEYPLMNSTYDTQVGTLRVARASA